MAVEQRNLTNTNLIRTSTGKKAQFNVEASSNRKLFAIQEILSARHELLELFASIKLKNPHTTEMSMLSSDFGTIREICMDGRSNAHRLADNLLYINQYLAKYIERRLMNQIFDRLGIPGPILR